MTEDKQTDEAPAAPAAKPKAAKPKKAKPAESLFARAEHIALARGMHGESRHVVAAALALLESKSSKVLEAYTKSEVAGAIKALASAKVKKGE